MAIPNKTGNLETTVETRLRADTLKFPSVVMQGITHMAPAVGLVLSLQFIASTAGIASPLAYATAFGIVLTLGVSLTQLAKHLPSAGGYYTYVSRAIHPRAGFLAAWLYFLYDPPTTPVCLAFMGFALEVTLKAQFGIHIPWWMFFLIFALSVTFLSYRGISISVNTMVVLTVAEMAILVALAVTCLLYPGKGGINFRSYLPSNAPSIHGFYLGVVFCISAFAGFESVAPLAEESEDPRRNLPRGIIWSILIIGALYLFGSWTMLVGWGTHDLRSFVQSGESPPFVLARRLWGGAWILLFIAVLNGIAAVSIASTNASTRVFFAMGRCGSLPSALSKVYPRYRTPVNAIWLQTLITLAVGLGLGFWIGPDQEFYFMSVAQALGLIFVYAAGNVAVFCIYRGERRSEFNRLLHVVFPMISTGALVFVGYASVVPPPPAPVRYAPWLTAGWLALGVIILWVSSRVGREDWLLKAGRAAYELPENSRPH
jgi:amino acid transporter